MTKLLPYIQALLAEHEAKWRAEDAARAWANRSRVCPATLHLKLFNQTSCRDCLETVCARQWAKGLDEEGLQLPYLERPWCDALIRMGASCQQRVIPGKARCCIRGGRSTGPKTPVGRVRIAATQRARWAKYRAAQVTRLAE